MVFWKHVLICKLLELEASMVVQVFDFFLFYRKVVYAPIANINCDA